ncbi:MAG: SH3 domain-containing protein [Clostridiales bacterium]|nr:SH3 domain-containing protein [Clostridiales bacterium]
MNKTEDNTMKNRRNIVSGIFKWGMLFALAFIFSAGLRAQNVSAATYEVNVSTGYLALRTEPAYNSSNEIGALYNGDTVEAGEVHTGNYWYVYSSKYSCYGYVNADYLVAVESDPVVVGTEIVDTGCYSIWFTPEYVGLYEYEIEDAFGCDYGKNLLVYDKASKAADNGGFVFGIYMYESNEYEDLPAYKLLGTMSPTNKPAKECSVVVVYPTDVQYTEETEDTWRTLYDGVEYMLKTFEADSGFNWFEAEDE